jgi:hypothetical protein
MLIAKCLDIEQVPRRKDINFARPDASDQVECQCQVQD